MWLCPSHPEDGGPFLPNADLASVDLVSFPPWCCIFPAGISFGGIGAALVGVGGS